MKLHLVMDITLGSALGVCFFRLPRLKAMASDRFGKVCEHIAEDINMVA